MPRNILRRFERALTLSAVLGGGVLGLLSKPARAQTETPTPVTCWAESCTGNVCVRIQIQCPKQIIVVG